MKKEIKHTTTIKILIITLMGIIAGIIYNNTAYYGLILGTILTVTVGYQSGYSLKIMGDMIQKGIKKAFIVLFIMTLIGMLSALWMMSGTIPAMMLLGFKYLTKMNFLLAAFLITGTIALVLGTSIGTMSTIGIPLMEIGNALGVPLPIVAGAIISGAYIGDRTSPMSSSANLTAAVTESKLMEMLREMLKTLAPALIGSMVIFYLIGLNYPMEGTALLRIEEIKTIINSYFIIEWYSLIPPLLILILAIMKLPIVYCMVTGLVSSIVLILFTQDSSLTEVIKVMWGGYYSDNGPVAELLSGGGLISMKNVIIIISISTGLNGLMESMGMLEPLMKGFLKGIKNTGHLILKTASLSILMAAFTCNQSLAVIVPSRFLKDEFKERGIPSKKLGRTIGDTGVVSVGIIPWNVNAIAITSILGIATLEYFPYALTCYLLPIITVLWGYGESKKAKDNITSSHRLEL